MNIVYNDFSNTTVFNNGRVPFFTFKAFKDSNVLHGFSTRLGGISPNEYSTMNLSYTVGDSNENVLKNFELFGNAIKIPVENMVYSHQTHTCNVMRVGKEHLGMGILRDRNFSDIDGLITNEKNICLVTSYADCVPLFIVDDENSAIGLSHSGWRGAVGNIAHNTVSLMKKEFGSKPEKLKVFIGPSICANCYEVSEDVANEFIIRYGTKAFDEIVIPKDNGKFKLNLWAANKTNFIESNVLEENIHITDVCTSCNSSLLFSHRASKGKRGGMCGFLMLK